MQLELFPVTQLAQRIYSPPLTPVRDTTYRVEVRYLWCPSAQRGTAALEVTDDDTRELIAWELLPGAESLEELRQAVKECMESAAQHLDYLDEPF